MIKFLNVEDIARTVHAAVVEGYWNSFNELEGVPWSELDEVCKKTAMETVVFIIKKPAVSDEELHVFYSKSALKDDDSLPISKHSKQAMNIALSIVKSLGHLVDPVELALYDTVK